MFGRLELLQVFNDPPAYWLIRLYGKERSYDAQFWDYKDTRTCWRFTSAQAAKAKFDQLCSHPEYQEEASRALAKRDRDSQRARRMQGSGQLVIGKSSAIAQKAGSFL